MLNRWSPGYALMRELGFLELQDEGAHIPLDRLNIPLCTAGPDGMDQVPACIPRDELSLRSRLQTSRRVTGSQGEEPAT
eukprot:750493-Hanusia_phi.AAC.5